MSGIPILHFLNRFWIGGSERQFVERLRAHPKGFEPVVACLERGGPLLTQVRDLGLEPIEFPLGGSMMRPNTAAQVARIAALVRDRGIPIIHATDFNTNLLGVAAARLASVKCIVSRVDLGHLREGFGKWHRRAEKLSSRAADVVCVNAEAVQKLCIREEGCTPDQVQIVYNGLDLKRFDALMARPLQKPLPETTGLRVAVIGNLWPVKGHRTLVEAAALLKPRFPDVQFLCAGEGPERQWIEKRTGELGLEKNVVLLGHRLDVPAILKSCDAGALCSSAEGLSNAIIEAMAARLPLVVTDVGGNGELVRDADNGFLVRYGHPESLADRISMLIENAERRREMGRRGRQRVETELSIERMQEAYGDLYRRLIDGAAEKKAG